MYTRLENTHPAYSVRDPHPSRPPTMAKTYIIEHLDPELESWSALEYSTIASECHTTGSHLTLSGVSSTLQIPASIASLRDSGKLTITTQSVEELYPPPRLTHDDGNDDAAASNGNEPVMVEQGTGDGKGSSRSRVCLLDPAAPTELIPRDGEVFDAFLFGGILGDDPPRGTYIQDLAYIHTYIHTHLPSSTYIRLPMYITHRYVRCATLRGSLPPSTPPTYICCRLIRLHMYIRFLLTTIPHTVHIISTDRTSELRKKGYAARRLGPIQMTTDTAVRVTRMVVQDGLRLDQVPYVDNPEIHTGDHESTQMPFRYVRGENGQPVMPEVSRFFLSVMVCYQFDKVCG